MLQIDGLSHEALLDEDKVNNGVWIHLDSAATDPDTGMPTPMYLGGDEAKPQRALVRSYRCKAIQDAEQKLQKDGFVKIRLAKKKEKDRVIAESSILSPARRFSLTIVALENFSAGGGVQQVTPEQGAWFYGESSMAAIVEQINAASYDDDNYLASAATAAGKPSPSIQTTAPSLETSES